MPWQLHVCYTPRLLVFGWFQHLHTQVPVMVMVMVTSYTTLRLLGRIPAGHWLAMKTANRPGLFSAVHAIRVIECQDQLVSKSTNSGHRKSVDSTGQSTLGCPKPWSTSPSPVSALSTPAPDICCTHLPNAAACLHTAVHPVRKIERSVCSPCFCASRL